MEEWLKKNWPLVAAGIVAILGVYLLTRNASQAASGGTLAPVGPSPDAVLQASTQQEQIAAAGSAKLLDAQTSIIDNYLNDFFQTLQQSNAETTSITNAKINAVVASKALDNQANLATEQLQLQSSALAARQQDALIGSVGTLLAGAFHF